MIEAVQQWLDRQQETAMCRSGYSDDCDNWALIRYRGQVAAATRGRRGQALLRELLDALDAMPEKRLIAEVLEFNGEYCALGVLGEARGVALSALDPYDAKAVGDAFDIATQLAREVVFMNDEGGLYNESPETRWVRMRAWVRSQIAEQPNADWPPRANS